MRLAYACVDKSIDDCCAIISVRLQLHKPINKPDGRFWNANVDLLGLGHDSRIFNLLRPFCIPIVSHLGFGLAQESPLAGAFPGVIARFGLGRTHPPNQYSSATGDPTRSARPCGCIALLGDGDSVIIAPLTTHYPRLRGETLAISLSLFRFPTRTSPPLALRLRRSLPDQRVGT